MLVYIPKTTPLIYLITLVFFLTGCGGPDTSNQRQSNSNPFAPSAHSNDSRSSKRSSNTSAPSRSQSPKISQQKKQPANTPQESLTKTPKKMTQKKTETAETETSSPTNIISEASKRTLDKDNPAVAIIVRGINGDEPKAIAIIENKMRASFTKPESADLTKQKPPVESAKDKNLEHFVLGKQLVLVVRPVPTDLFAFAQNLKWGKVKEIDIPNRIITIETQLQELVNLPAQNNATSTSSDSSVKVTAKDNSTNPAKPAMNKPETKPGKSNPLTNDRDLKPRPDEETLDWALRVIAGTSSFAHDTACKELVQMKPDIDELQRVSSVLATTLPLAKTGFRMTEHVNAMSIWYTDEATMAFAALLADEKSGLVREEIIGLLPKIRTEVSAEVLVGRLSNRKDKKKAFTALRILGKIAEKPVSDLLNDPDSSMRMEACKLLQSIGTQESIPALKKQAEIEESSVVKRLISETQDEINKKSASPEK
ncbi:MAG: HEAT repeat domain-containing protein [Gimesia sp.]